VSEPTILRCSSLSSYADCNRRGAARMFRREIEAAGFKLRQTPYGIGAAAGSSVHKAAEVTLAEKAHAGELPPLSVATDCAVETLRESVRQGVIFDGPRGATQNATIAERQVVGMTAAYHRVIAPTVHPILVEERLEAEVAPGLVLSGRPDLVAREPGQIRDLKTGSRTAGSHNPQVGGYSLLARSHGAEIETAAIDFVRRVAPNKPQPDPSSQTVPVAEAETAAINIIRHIAEDLRVFREGDAERRLLPGDPWAFQANPMSILCSAKWCSAWGTEFCREHLAKEESE
jgi:hypothetical protein